MPQKQARTTVPSSKKSDDALQTFLGDAGVVLFLVIVIALAVRSWRRRSRLTPEQRTAEDQLAETRRLRRAIEQGNRWR